MQAEFEEAAFNLKPGELTERPIETQSGWHIIERYDAPVQLPPLLTYTQPRVNEPSQVYSIN